MLNVSKERLAIATEQAKNIINGLTLTEKIGQLSQYGTSIYNDKTEYHTYLYDEGKIGAYLTVCGCEITNRLQKEFKEKAPTFIPLLFGHDVIHGYKTIFPTPLAQSCSWNPEAAKEGASVAAKEAYAAGIRWNFSPMVDIARDPRWGRIVEGYGEDTYLCSRFSEETVKGYQGDEIGQEDKILACMKHLAGYGAGTGGRDYESVDMSLQTLHDVYLPPFKAGFQAGSATAMSAFHSLNGVPCTGNKMLLRDVLRSRFGFDGFVVSDAGSVHEMVAHGYTPDLYNACYKALTSGINMLMSGDIFSKNLPEMIEKGDISEDQIDSALLPIITLKFLLGLFENPYTDPEKEKCLLCDEHRKVALDLAKECAVLLQNDGTLPLDKAKKIALIGPLADNKDDVLGPWSINKEIESNVTIKQGFENMGLDVVCAKGCEIEQSDASLLSDAIKAAKDADAAVLVLGEAEYMSGEAKSRSHITLPKPQEELLEAVSALGKPIVLLISAGRPIIIESYKDKANAIMYIWQLGTECGNAVAQIVCGECDASGRLTVSVPKFEGQIPVYYNRYNTGRPALGLVWYETRYIDNSPLADIPFGFGLSYTEFEYSNLALSNDKMADDGYIDVSVDIKNIGARKGSTVAQLYIKDHFASRVRPIMELKGFKKIELSAGESRRVTLRINANELGFHDEDLNYIVEKGTFSVWVGQNCKDDKLTAEFEIV